MAAAATRGSEVARTVPRIAWLVRSLASSLHHLDVGVGMAGRVKSVIHLSPTATDTHRRRLRPKERTGEERLTWKVREKKINVS